MTSLTDKRKLGYDLKSERSEAGFGRSGSRSLLVTVIVVWLSGLLVGYVFGGLPDVGPEIDLPGSVVTVSGAQVESETVFKVDGYRIVFQNSSHPLMTGSWGYIHSHRRGEGRSGTMYLNSGYRSPEDLYSTCVHEKLHLLGVSSEFHDWIRGVENEVVDDTCLRLLYVLPGGSGEGVDQG